MITEHRCFLDALETLIRDGGALTYRREDDPNTADKDAEPVIIYRTGEPEAFSMFTRQAQAQTVQTLNNAGISKIAAQALAGCLFQDRLDEFQAHASLARELDGLCHKNHPVIAARASEADELADRLESKIIAALKRRHRK